MDKLKDWIGCRVEVGTTFNIPDQGILTDFRMDHNGNGLWLLLDDRVLFNWQFVTTVWKMTDGEE